MIVHSEPLALGVASEWDSQKDTIDRATMHLTAMVNTAVDNPNNLTKIDIVNYLINYIQTDTVLYHYFVREIIFISNQNLQFIYLRRKRACMSYKALNGHP